MTNYSPAKEGRKLQLGVISPQDWGLAVAETVSEEPIEGLGVSPAELERRVRANTYQWLPGQFNEREGAFHGHYNAVTKRLDTFHTVNLIAPWQCLAAYDRYGDERWLAMAQQAADWFYEHFVISHPMSVVVGGVRDTVRREELWTKYAAEHVILNVGVYRRSGEPRFLQRARQSGSFLVQSKRHDYAPKYDQDRSEWVERGWLSFGRAVEAFLDLHQMTKESFWLEQAVAWGEYGLTLQAADGGFYLLNGEYYNSDIAADELRALSFLYELTGEEEFLRAARRFAEWHLKRQREDGAWPVNIDRDGNVIADVAGPGDMPNIAIALLRLYHLTGEEAYWQGAMRAFRYSLSTQAIPGSDHPYLDDPRVLWGFWSWDPYYDYTLSADQSTHHVRGMMFLLDYLPVKQDYEAHSIEE